MATKKLFFCLLTGFVNTQRKIEKNLAVQM